MHVWIIHDPNGAVLSVHGSQESAAEWRAIRGLDAEWVIQRWDVRR